MTSELDLSAYDLSKYDSYEEAMDSFEWSIPDRFNMGTSMIDANAEQRGQVAIFWDRQEGAEETWTFSQLMRRSNQLSNALSEFGIKKGDVVGVCLPVRPESVLSYAGIWKRGAVSLPLPVILGEEGFKYRLSNSGCKLLIAHADYIETIRNLYSDLDQLQHVLVIGDTELKDIEMDFTSCVASQSVESTPEVTSADDDALLVYTSGTTGDPKGVVHAHRLVLGMLPGFYMKFNIDIDGIYYTAIDWTWMGSLTTILPALLTGQSVVASNYKKFRPAEQLSLLERYGVTHGDFPPTALNMLRQADITSYDLDLKMVLSGGEALSPETFRYFESHGIPVLEGYGQTEATPLICNCESFFDIKIGSMGKPVPGHELKLVEEHADEEGVGEIALKTPDPVKFKRYIGASDNGDNNHDGEWYLTGDLARVDEDGYFWYKSRADNIIISSGYRISPVEVENTIMEHEAVDNVVVTGVEDDVRGSIVKAYIKTHSTADKKEELADDIQTLVKQQLAKYEYPREIEFIDEIPKTITGKKDRNALTE